MTKARAKRSLEPIGTYDPYHPRVYGTANEILKGRHRRELANVDAANEAFASEKRQEIDERTRQQAEQDINAIEVLKATAKKIRRIERHAHKLRMKRQ